MRDETDAAILAALLESRWKRIVTVELVLQVRRDEQNHLSGDVRASNESSAHKFSGILELVQVFEELVPAAGPPPGHEFGEQLGSEERT